VDQRQLGDRGEDLDVAMHHFESTSQAAGRRTSRKT